MWKIVHSIRWNSLGIAETPDDERLGPKHVVKGRRYRNSCIIHGIIFCIKELTKFDTQKFSKHPVRKPILNGDQVSGTLLRRHEETRGCQCNAFSDSRVPAEYKFLFLQFSFSKRHSLLISSSSRVFCYANSVSIWDHCLFLHLQFSSLFARSPMHNDAWRNAVELWQIDSCHYKDQFYGHTSRTHLHNNILSDLKIWAFVTVVALFFRIIIYMLRDHKIVILVCQSLTHTLCYRSNLREREMKTEVFSA